MKYSRSRYTLWAARGSRNGLLLNTLSGAVDLASPELVRLVSRQAELEFDPSDESHQMLLDRGYYVESLRVEKAVARRLTTRAKAEAAAGDPPKFMFLPTLNCNLACPYCWQVIEQGGRRRQSQLMKDEAVQAAFDYLQADLGRRRRSPKGAIVSLFGGEPLIDAPAHHRLVRLIGDRCMQLGMHLHFATNGKDLAAFSGEIADYRPSIQVTADGLEFIDGRPCLLRAGQRLENLYGRVADLAAAGTAQFVLRFLVAEHTTGVLRRLADAVARDSRLASHFTLMVAPIQDRSSGAGPGASPKSRLLAAVVDQLDGHPYAPQILAADWRSLALLNGVRRADRTPPFPGFYHCEANVDLTCFDSDGYLYACYEAAGDRDLAFGTYWPRVRIDPKRLDRFRRHSAWAVHGCAKCALGPICGGGCRVYRLKKTRHDMKSYCEDLRLEVAEVLRNWRQVVRTFAPASAEAEAPSALLRQA
jgi:uncharacterized protein